VLVIEINQDVAMRAIRRQQDQYDEIRNQQRRIKGVRVIQALKSLIEKMLTNVLPDPFRGDEGSESAKRDGDAVQLRRFLSQSKRAYRKPPLYARVLPNRESGAIRAVSGVRNQRSSRHGSSLESFGR